MFRKSVGRNNTAGFTLIETLFSLAITLAILISVASIMRMVTVHRKIELLYSNCEIAAKQIAQTLVTAKYKSFGEKLVFIDENEKEFTITVDKNRIVKTPGYDIYTHGIDDIYFALDNHKVYMEVVIKEEKVRYLVGSDYYQEIKEETDEDMESKG